MAKSGGSSLFRRSSRTFVLIFLLPVTMRGEDAPQQLRNGESVLLAQTDGSSIGNASSSDGVITLLERGAAEVVARITPLDRAGAVLGSGRLIVMAPSEERRVRLRDVVAPDVPDAVQLRVEVLQGQGRVTVGMEEARGLKLQPLADSPRRRRSVRHPGPPLSSEELIDAAESAGQLDSETALLFRVYAIFGDARLPDRYQGDDSAVIDSLYMEVVHTRLASLSPSTQAVLQPFLIPPAYEGSWSNTSYSGPTASIGGPPRCEALSGDWAWVNTFSSPVRIWFRIDRPNDEALALTMINVIDNDIWPRFAALMHPNVPLDDSSQKCGGDSRFDIYIDDVTKSNTGPYALFSCRQANPVFMILRRTVSKAVLAHEIFHAFQYSYPLNGCMLGEDYEWWAEGTAQWAMDWVYRGDKEKQGVAPHYLNEPSTTLEQGNNKHKYGTYLLPYFLEKKIGSADFVRKTWVGCAGKAAVEALDDALSNTLESRWHQFARANWNRDPVKDYRGWDGLTDGARTQKGNVEPMDATPDDSSGIIIFLPRLSAVYQHFEFKSNVSTVAFWNAITFELTLEEQPLKGLQYQVKPAPADHTKGIHVHALIKIAGVWTEEDWTGKGVVKYCRDKKAERIEELVLIVSNGRIEPKTFFKPLQRGPVLWASNMGCWKWTGDVTFKYPNSLYTVTTNVTWEMDPVNGWVPSGNQTWAFNAPCKTVGAGGPRPIPTTSQALTVMNYTPRQGAAYRSYQGSGPDNRDVYGDCAGTPAPFPVPSWWSTPLSPAMSPANPNARFLTVDSTGRLMDGSYEVLFRWEWHLTAETQK